MKSIFIVLIALAFASCAQQAQKPSFYSKVDPTINWTGLENPADAGKDARITKVALDIQGKQMLYLVEITASSEIKKQTGFTSYRTTVHRLFRYFDRVCDEQEVIDALKNGWTYSYILVPADDTNSVLSKLVYRQETCAGISQKP